MKKPILIIAISLMVVAGLLVWVFSSNLEFKLEEFGMLGALLLLTIGMIIFAIRRFKSMKQGEPFEDELSKKIMRQAASTSYFISLYWWLALSYTSENWDYDTETVIGIGIGGMAVLFFLSWTYYKIKGLKNG